eukprot:6069081-Prymnesium_polylepis.2
MLGYVRKCRPHAVVLENVASLLSPHRRHAFDSVCAMLLDIHGYTWYVGVLCPGDHGVVPLGALACILGGRAVLSPMLSRPAGRPRTLPPPPRTVPRRRRRSR